MADLEEEVLGIAEPIGHPLEDLDIVVDAFEHTGVQSGACQRCYRPVHAADSEL